MTITLTWGTIFIHIANMAATMNSCVRRKVIHFCGLLKTDRHCFSVYAYKTNTSHRFLFNTPKQSYATLTLLCKRHYCEKVKGTITDEILKERVANNQTEGKQDEAAKSEEHSEKKQQKKEKGFHIFGRYISATALGFWFFGITMTTLGISLVIVMGNILTCKLVQYKMRIFYILSRF